MSLRQKKISQTRYSNIDAKAAYDEANALYGQAYSTNFFQSSIRTFSFYSGKAIFNMLVSIGKTVGLDENDGVVKKANRYYYDAHEINRTPENVGCWGRANYTLAKSIDEHLSRQASANSVESGQSRINLEEVLSLSKDQYCRAVASNSCPDMTFYYGNAISLMLLAIGKRISIPNESIPFYILNKYEAMSSSEDLLIAKKISSKDGNALLRGYWHDIFEFSKAIKGHLDKKQVE